jgi:hypothetical protein
MEASIRSAVSDVKRIFVQAEPILRARRAEPRLSELPG